MVTPPPAELAFPALVPDPDQVLGWLWEGIRWLLAQVPPPLGILGYIVLAIWLTRRVVRHVQPVPLNPADPMFQQPGGALPWICVSGLRLLLIAVAAGGGFALPQSLANSLWRDPHAFGDVPLGVLGRLSEIVGLVCGLVIGVTCQYQLNVLLAVGLIGYWLWRLVLWVVGG